MLNNNQKTIFQEHDVIVNLTFDLLDIKLDLFISSNQPIV